MVCRCLRSAFPYLGRSCCGNIRKEEASKALRARGLTGGFLAGLSVSPRRVSMNMLAGRPWGWRRWGGRGHPSALLWCSQPPFRTQHSRPTRHAQSLCSNCCQTPRRSPCHSLHCAHPENTALPSSPPGLTFRRTQGEQITVPPAKKGPHTLCPGEFAEKTKGGHSNLWLQFQMDLGISLTSHLSPPLWGGREPKSRFLGCQMLC